MSDSTPSTLTLSKEQLTSLGTLAARAHDHSTRVREIEDNGLPWIEVNVLLTDMGDTPPLHTFWIDPRGTIHPRGGRKAARS